MDSNFMWNNVRHFAPSEFDHPEWADPVFLFFLDEVRAEMGRLDPAVRFKVTSGGRDPEHNERVGGVPTSLHIYNPATNLHFRAVDFVTPTLQTRHRPYGEYWRMAHISYEIGERAEKAVQLELVKGPTDWHYHLGLHLDRPFKDSELIIAVD